MTLPQIPLAYRWMVERGLVGFEAFSALQPWYFFRASDFIDVVEQWPDKADAPRLIAFARKQDCDDLACFELDENGEATAAVVLIQGWTAGGRGFQFVQRYETFWDWLKSAIDDVAFWCSLVESDARPE